MPDPIRCLARPSQGMTTRLDAASAMPTKLVSACEPFTSTRTDSMAT